MRNVLVGLGLALTSQLAAGQIVEEKLPIYCAGTDQVFNGLRDKYEERPVAIGTAGEVKVTVWMNKQTKTFTIVATSKDKKTSCIITTGTEFNSSLIVM